MTCRIPKHIEDLKVDQRIKQHLAGIHFDIFRELINSQYFVQRNNLLQEHSDRQIMNRGREIIGKINQRYGKYVAQIDTSRPRIRAVSVDVEKLLPEIEDAYSRLKDNQELGISYTGDSILQVESFIEDNPSDVTQTLNNLSKRFNIPWTEDSIQTSIGRFENGMVYVNMNKVKSDTPIHEFAHPFVSLLRNQNYSLYRSLVNKIPNLKYKNRSIESFVRNNYQDKNYTEQDIQEEVITTAIGLAAADLKNFSEPETARNLLQDFLIWLKNFFSLKLNRIINLDKNTSISEIAQLFTDSSISIDLSQQEFSTQPKFQEETKEYSKSGEFTKILEDKNKDVSLNEVDPKNTFYIKGDTKLSRLTEWVTTTFSSVEKQEKLSQKTPAEWSASKYYRKYNKSHSETVKWEQTGLEVSFDQLVSIFEDIHLKIRKKGSLIHAIIQDNLDKTNSTKERVQQLYEESDTSTWQMKWLDDVYINNLLRNTLNLNIGSTSKGTGLEDSIKSEFTIASETLGIGTTIDMLAEHSNNSFSLFDFKTGSRFLDDSATIDEMKYSELVGDIIKDSKLDKGKMELMLRAFIIKEQIPQSRFRELAIVHMGNRQEPTVYSVSMSNYLSVLEQYFKKEKPDLYTEYSKKGLFDFKNYTSSSKEQLELEFDPELSKMDVSQTIEYLLNKIEQLKNKAETQNRGEIPRSVKDKISKYSKLVLDLQRETNLDFKSESRDIGFFERWLGVDFEMSNPVVSKFVRLFRSRASESHKEFNKIKYKQQKMVSALLKEYYAKNPEKKITNQLIGGSITYHNEQNTGFWDFMWDYKTVGETSGYYARIITTEQVRNGEYTQAQYDYNVWYRETVGNLWKETLSKAAYDGIPKEEFLNMKYDESFMPRIPKSHEEEIEQVGFFSKENLKRSVTSVTDMFIKEERKSWKNSQEIGVPVKYLGSQSIIANQIHSFNAEEALLAYAKNMIYKKNVDQMYSLGKGVIEVIGQDVSPDGKQSLKRTIDWLNDYLELQIADRKEEIQLTKGETKILGKKVSVKRVAMSANNYVSASSMWLNVGAGMFNSALVSMFTGMIATRNSISKRLGMDVDYSLSDWLWSTKEYVNRFIGGKIKNIGQGDRTYEQDDLAHRFIDFLGYDTSTFKDIIDKKDVLTSKNKLLSQRRLYIFHTVGEEFGLFSTMMASLKAYKIKDGKGNWIKINPDGTSTVVSSKKEASGMWDAYKIVDGEMTYIGPSRGFTSSGEEIKGLTGDEISKLKRISQRIHGSYREDEKIPVERFLLGTFLMKFKKYLPNILAYNFQGRFDDWSLGNYEQLFNEDGTPKLKDGQFVYDWVAQVNEGRLNVLSKFLVHGLITSKFSENPAYDQYRWENLSQEQKKVMIDVGIATLTFLMSIGAANWYFDDEDEATMVYKRFVMLQENLVQVHPMDILRMANEPFVQVKTIYKTSEALGKFVLDGFILGEL